MKTLTTMTAVAALIAGISFANAQNATTPNTATPPPSSINAGSGAQATGVDAARSGSQMKASGKMDASGKMGSTKMGVTGKSKFCLKLDSSASGYNCKFDTLAACEKEATVASRKSCAPNPNMAATTGMKAK